MIINYRERFLKKHKYDNCIIFSRGKNTRPWYSIKESKDIIYNQPINGIYQASTNANSFEGPFDSCKFSGHQSSKIHGHRKA